ncbi:MAG: SRPBCC family protein, partial [Saprospiraceae bacterium]|nr:SRPBCC family protein [Saprospiraceae bacterium]
SSEGQGSGTQATRTMVLAPGAERITERITQIVPPRMILSYEMVSGDLPVQDYRETVRVRIIPEGGAEVSVSTDFSSRAAMAPDMYELARYRHAALYASLMDR